MSDGIALNDDVHLAIEVRVNPDGSHETVRLIVQETGQTIADVIKAELKNEVREPGRFGMDPFDYNPGSRRRMVTTLTLELDKMTTMMKGLAIDVDGHIISNELGEGN